MLIPAEKLLAPVPRTDPVREVIALASSVALHAAVVAILLLRPGRALPPTAPPLEIEMVQQQLEVRGAPPPPATAAAPDTPPAPASPTAAVSPPAPPLPAQQQATAPSAAAPPSAPATRRQTAPQHPAAEVNLGNAGEDIDPLSVTGDNVVPPGPDTRYRNRPPGYPPAAARIGAEGTVQLVARIASNGLPLSVGVVGSSGNTDLDEEARRAVLLWRFRPAREGGRAIPYDYTVNIRFALGDR